MENLDETWKDVGISGFSRPEFGIPRLGSRGENWNAVVYSQAEARK